MMEEILRVIRQTAADDRQLPADPADLGLLPVKGFAPPPRLKSQSPTFRKLTGSRSTDPAALE